MLGIGSLEEETSRKLSVLVVAANAYKYNNRNRKCAIRDFILWAI